MLLPRIIPCLLLKSNGLYNSYNFSNYIYLGDPINIVKIFSEKNVDEIIILDIEKTINNIEPDYNFIKKIANEATMPLTYGGGIRNESHIEKIINAGVEKITISSLALDYPEKIKKLINIFGSQSISVVIDVRWSKEESQYKIFTHSGAKKSNRNFLNFLKFLNEIKIGEVIINSIDLDGTRKGYDENLIKILKKNLIIPKTILGGASSFSNINDCIQKYGIMGYGATSIFVYQGKLDAVLLSYPEINEKNKINNEIS